MLSKLNTRGSILTLCCGIFFDEQLRMVKEMVLQLWINISFRSDFTCFNLCN